MNAQFWLIPGTLLGLTAGLVGAAWNHDIPWIIINGGLLLFWITIIFVEEES